MALLYVDGFEHQDLRRYTGVSSCTFVGGRTAGGNAIHVQFSASTFTASLNQTPSSSTYYIGFAHWMNTVGGVENMSFNIRNSGKSANCVYLHIPNTLVPVVYKGSNASVIATSSIGLAPVTWYHIGLEVTIGASTSGKLYINQVQAASWSGVDTRNGGDQSTISGVSFTRGGPNNYNYVDDLYIMDGSGTTNNSWPGDLMVRTLFPNAAGSSTQWTVSPSGANYAAVDETGSAGADYVYSNTVGNTDLYAVQDLPATGVYDIKGVQVSGIMASSDAGAVNAAMLSRANSVTSEGPTTLLAATAGHVYGVFPEASSGIPWTKTLVDGMEAGVRVK